MTFTERIARAASRHPWRTIGAWALVLVVSFVCIGALLGSALTTEFVLTNNPEFERADKLIDERLERPEQVQELVIVRSRTHKADDQEFQSAVERLAGQIRRSEGVANVVSYYQTREPSLVSGDRDAVLVPIAITGDEAEAEPHADKVMDIVAAADGEGGFETYITGEASGGLDQQEVAQHDLKVGELQFGLPAALIILVLVFGALVAAAIPLIMAITSIIIAIALVALVGQAAEFSFFVINMIFGMGLALGIDYSLFVLSRYREERVRGQATLDAIAASGATSSRAVFFSGVTFVIALVGMLLVPLNVLKSLAAGAILVGIVAVIAALTLLPALLTVLGDRVNAARIPLIGRSAERAGSEGRFWSWAAHGVMRRPVPVLLIVAAALIALSIPAFSLENGSGGITAIPDRYPSKQGFLVLSEEFPRATAQPVEIAVDGEVGSPDVRAAIRQLQSTLANTPPFGRPDARIEEDRNFALLTVPIGGDPEGTAATEAVRNVRNEIVPRTFDGVDAEVLVGGHTGNVIDYLDATSDWLVPVFAVVLALSFILLTIAFHSIVVALKAIVLNLLSVGAAYGLLVLVFQKGYATDFFGFTQVDTIEAWVPLFLFSVLFGLSMDYHVFLLSRIRERFSRTGDNTDAVAHGISSTARLITGAALIIIVVFAGFARGDLVMFQQMGFGVAVALLLDATIIRSLLVPATMKLLGATNWYLPSWLRWLPEIGVEGERPQPAAAVPRPNP